jgi:hypothetical protein
MGHDVMSFPVWIRRWEFHRAHPPQYRAARTMKSAALKSALSKSADKIERIERSMMGAALVAAVVWAVMQG